jgi:hypothetical protein
MDTRMFIPAIAFMALGAYQIRRPQEFFAMRNFPLTVRDGLTDEGRRAYEYQGAFVFVIGLLFGIWGLLA